MDIGGYSRQARRNASILRDRLETERPGFGELVREKGARVAAESLGISVLVHDLPPQSQCSVAGSSDATARVVSVVRGPTARMTFTVLHEIVHVEGATDADFQEAIFDTPTGRRDAEEDACEAFAAQVLLADKAVDIALGDVGLTAAGMASLVAAFPGASREACAVALAHRLRSPGYVAILTRDGSLQFAARSGDVFPLRRKSDQSETDVWSRLLVRTAVRGVGHFAFAGGSLTERLYVDALRHEEGAYVIAVTDSPAWPALHVPDAERFEARVASDWCEICVVEFRSTQRCASCGAARHPSCGRCHCDPEPVRGARACRVCHIVHGPAMFSGTDPTVCDDHS